MNNQNNNDEEEFRGGFPWSDAWSSTDGSSDDESLSTSAVRNGLKSPTTTENLINVTTPPCPLITLMQTQGVYDSFSNTTREEEKEDGGPPPKNFFQGDDNETSDPLSRNTLTTPNPTSTNYELTSRWRLTPHSRAHNRFPPRARNSLTLTRKRLRQQLNNRLPANATSGRRNSHLSISSAESDHVPPMQPLNSGIDKCVGTRYIEWHTFHHNGVEEIKIGEEWKYDMGF